jgi:hypothetical protein
MIKEIFDLKWNKAKYLWQLDNLCVRKVLNTHRRELYDDAYYRGKYYFSLTEAKDAIRKCHNLRSPDGHENSSPALEEYVIIKYIKSPTNNRKEKI